jgi:hypothetical protein
MALPSGTRVGPYEIAGLVGAGGMGEVYRARDTRLERDVAVKLLPMRFAGDAERLRRFEQEARAAGRLSHPNVVVVYDVGLHEGAPYVVTELLQGASLREVLQAPLPLRKAVGYAREVALALAAAHEQGIVHRDLKPENVFVTSDGRAKVLDFGLAKLLPVSSGDGAASGLNTLSAEGLVAGTVGYMAPEQVRGRAVDHRADLFALGVVLYEMLTGSRAFRAESPVETMNAILKEEPELAKLAERTSPALARVVTRCLEKAPEERFQSARDLAFALEAATDASAPAAVPALQPPTQAGPKRRRAGVAIVALAGVATAGAAFLIGRSVERRQRETEGGVPSSFQRLTFGRGAIGSARFTKEGTIVAAAAWEGRPSELFVLRPNTPDAQPLGLRAEGIFAASARGDLAIAMGGGRTLASLPLAGGAPRPLLEDVVAADWMPDDRSLAVVRQSGTKQRLEAPIGQLRAETDGHSHGLRVAPQGELLAWIAHDSELALELVDERGGRKRIWKGGGEVNGFAWTPDAREIWLTEEILGNSTVLHRIPLSGRARRVAAFPGGVSLLDIGPDGRMLLRQTIRRQSVALLGSGVDAGHRELSWLDNSNVADISPDGRHLLIYNPATTGLSFYLRPTDGSPAIRLGEGHATALSPDGRFVLYHVHTGTATELRLLPTGAGDTRVLDSAPVVLDHQATFSADGREVLAQGHEKDKPRERARRLYLLPLDGGSPRAVTPEGTLWPAALSADKRLVAACDDERHCSVYPADGRSPALRELPAGHRPIRFSGDGRSLFTFHPGEGIARVYRVDLATGAASPFKELALPDRAGVAGIGSIVLTPDGDTCAFSYMRSLSELYLADTGPGARAQR